MIVASSLPWLVPGIVATVAMVLAAHRGAARILRVSRGSAAAILFCLGVVLCGTLTPLRDALDYGAIGTGTCDTSRVTLPSIDELLAISRNDSLVNVLLFVPLGFVIASARWGPWIRALAFAVLALPVLIEMTQLALPVLARSCESADVVDNVTGYALGLFMGAIIGGTLRLRAGQRRR